MNNAINSTTMNNAMMNNTIRITYIGNKISKKDTITGSRIIFPRHAPVDVPSATAYSLLAYQDSWILYDNLSQHQQQQEQAQQEQQQQQAQQQAQAALMEQQLSYIVSTSGGQRDISKLTGAQLETLAESENLNIVRQPKQKTEDYRNQIRDAFRAREGTASGHGTV